MGKRVIVIPNAEQRDLQQGFLDWLKQRIPVNGDFDADECRTIASVLVHDDRPAEILAVVALNHWTPTTVEGNIASDGSKRWFSREFAYTVYDYVFRHAGKTRFNFTLSPDNLAAKGMHEKLGHKYECRLEDAYGEGQDALLYGLTRKQWQSGPWAKP